MSVEHLRSGRPATAEEIDKAMELARSLPAARRPQLERQDRLAAIEERRARQRVVASKREDPKPGTLTVGGLIAILQDLPQDMPVLVEGCDCYGEAVGASVNESGSGWHYPHVLVKR